MSNITVFLPCLHSARLGNIDFTPPEAFSPGNNTFGKKSHDIWACGIVLYLMLEGKHPFQANGPESPKHNRIHEVLRNIQEFVYPPLSNASSACMSLIEKMLCPVQHRIGITEIAVNPWCVNDAPDSYLDMNSNIRSNDERAMENVEKNQSTDQITRYLVSCSFGGLDNELNSMIQQVIVENGEQ